MENIKNITEIMQVLPHRYPFLLVDRVLEMTPGKGIVALKNVTINEEFFNGHFPSHPVMPGVLLIEAMAQAAGIFVMAENEGIEPAQNVVYFMSIEEAKFRKPVVPGDQLRLCVDKMQNRGKVWKMKGEVLVEGAKVAEAVFTAMIVKRGTNG
jgi:3-hydroxyacyl-[acyl-carrier-protein] dehydratase